MYKQNKIDKNKINTPIVEFTPSALEQLSLIISNDFTIKNKFFRVMISGKECDGFTYSTGFTDKNDDDFIIDINNSISIVMDPFSSFYLQKFTVDFTLDLQTNSDGFIIINNNQEKFSDKFWINDKFKIPPISRDIQH